MSTTSLQAGLRTALRLTALAIVAVVGGQFACAQSWPGEAWEISTPEAEGIDPQAIEELVADIRSGRYGLVDEFLLIRHGRIVADFHFEHDYEAISAPYDPKDEPYDYDHPAWHPYYRKTRLHSLQSVSKSITSAALGIAIDEGLIPGGVAAPAMSFFGEYKTDLSEPFRQQMTVEDLLTMRSGIRWNEMISYDDSENSCIRMEAAKDWIQFVLDQPMREEPGTVFDYNSGASVLLGKIVGEATGQRVDTWTAEKLFSPLGIRDYYWKLTPAGEVDTEGGLYLSSHDLARIAYLFLRNGNWNGHRVVSADWVRTSIAPHVADIDPDNGRPDSAYGYQWWVDQPAQGEPAIFKGSGYGGQFPIVVPEYDMVVVFNAWNIHDPPELQTAAAVRDRILPATRK
jgi:CubicO group peptidase (beta-lactamase class C family)